MYMLKFTIATNPEAGVELMLLLYVRRCPLVYIVDEDAVFRTRYRMPATPLRLLSICMHVEDDINPFLRHFDFNKDNVMSTQHMDKAYVLFFKVASHFFRVLNFGLSGKKNGCKGFKRKESIPLRYSSFWLLA